MKVLFSFTTNRSATFLLVSQLYTRCADKSTQKVINLYIKGVKLKLIVSQTLKFGQSCGPTLMLTQGITVHPGITVQLFIWTQTRFPLTHREVVKIYTIKTRTLNELKIEFEILK